MGYTFGAYLRQRRRLKGISQQDFADRLSYKRTNISAIEHGTQKPPNCLIAKMSEILEEPYADMLAVKILDGLSLDVEEALWRLLCRRRGDECE